MIISGSHGEHFARRLGRYSKLHVDHFPDSELYVRLPRSVRGKKLVFVQSFYSEVNEVLVESIFAAATARDLGARTLTLVAPYFPYFRQDKRFHPGECVSIDVVSKLVSHYFDELLVIDPHLHRRTAISSLFSIPAHNLTANPLIGDYIKKNIKNPLLVGPDIESYKWAEKTAKLIGADFTILRKTRRSSRKVVVRFTEDVDVKNKHAVLVDDIISTGNTLLQTIKHLKRLKVKKITCICVHGIFAEGALAKLRKTGATVVSTNTIPNPVAKIDVSRLVKDAL